MGVTIFFILIVGFLFLWLINEITEDDKKTEKEKEEQEEKNKIAENREAIFYKKDPNANFEKKDTTITEDKKEIPKLKEKISHDNNHNVNFPKIKSKKTENEKENFQDYRETHPKPFRCLDGHCVRSKSEREIDNYLYQNKIWHIYEYKYEHPITKDTAYTDFYLPEYNLFIEYFGLSSEEYISKRDWKIKMYKSDKSINFEYLTYKDDCDIYEKLKSILNKYN
jgi:cell division protein FtsI/penicillin-binding protein 2